MTSCKTTPETLTVEDLFTDPVRAAATISPDGTKIAYLAPWKNRLNIWVQSVDSPDDARCVTADDNRSVHLYEWTDNSRWLLYMQDNDGDENHHVYRVDLDNPDSAPVDLTPFPGVKAFFELPAGRSGKALVNMNNRRIDMFDAYELDITSGELTLLAENPGYITGFMYSRSGALLGFRLTDSGDVELLEWDSAAATSRSITVYDGADHPLGVFPMVVTPDGSGIWLGSNKDTDRMRLARLDVATGEETEVDSHPEFDLDPRGQVAPTLPQPLILHRRTGELLGVRYSRERQVIHALDPDFAAVLKNLEQLSDGDLGHVSSDDSGHRWVVSFVHDRDPHATYLYDHRTGESRLLFRPFPHLDPEQLAPMQPVTITSRDGLDLYSYLTLPVGVEPKGLPLVLLVHGGPWYRDSWGYDPAAQLFANRGYAVLHVNFRGSTGYGKTFMKAAIGEFAGKMHDDLIDAVDWAVTQGYADRDRVAIFGGSYGGYATLVGVSFTPDVFAAAVDYVGISNLANFMKTLPAVARPHLANNWHRYVGDPDDPKQLADMLARSPITKADQIRTPLMVIQGANDVRVVQAESDNLVDALRARGVEVEYHLQHNEGHGAVNPENVIAMYHAIDRFFAQHLNG